MNRWRRANVSWQITPRAPPELLTNGDAEPANPVMKAALAMDKLAVAAVRKAAGPSEETS